MAARRARGRERDLAAGGLCRAALAALSPDAAVKADFSIDPNGELIDMTVRRNDSTAGQRMIIRMRRRDDAKPVELRAQLQGVGRDGKPALLSETWSYILPGE